MRAATYSLLLALVGASTYAWLAHGDVQDRHSAFAWFVMPGLACLLALSAHVLGNLLLRRPTLLNLPQKDRFLSLPPERQRRVTRHSRRLMEWMALEITIVLSLIQMGIYYQPDSSEFNGFVIAALVFAMGVSPVVVFLHVGRMQEEVKRQLREQ